MSKPVCWVERMEDGVKREVRVTFAGARSIRWQRKRADEDRWTYDYAPTPGDWDRLLELMENRYRRRSVSWKLMELARAARAEAAQ
jgi:hypothetical protein